LVCCGASVALRAALVPLLGGPEHIVSIFPALLVATYLGGLIGGSSCLALTLLGDWYLFLGPPRSFTLAPHEGADLVAILTCGALIVAGTAAIRNLVSDLGEAHEAERLLARELQHRVKNNLAVIEALATHSARGVTEVDDFLARFLGRLRSVSTAQNMLSASEAGDVSVTDVVRGALSPFTGTDQIIASGDDLTIDGRQAVALALCLHELATNAIKYGALRATGGCALVHWRRTGDRLGSVEWRETGGEPPLQPQREGSGLRLLRRGVDLHRPTRLTFAAAGLNWRCEFETPLDHGQAAWSSSPSAHSAAADRSDRRKRDLGPTSVARP
jgi:two-component sensor histidine kinase